MGKFKKVETPIKDLYVIEPVVFGDERGYFLETYNYKDFIDIGIDKVFVQDNQSKSKQGVLRGMHFQHEHQQAKLIKTISGEIYDVAVDLRSNSHTFGKWFGIILSAENKKQFYIPEGFAHGFLVLSKEAEITYKCSDYYHPEFEDGFLWNDEGIGINWPLEKIEKVILSEKDVRWKKLSI